MSELKKIAQRIVGIFGSYGLACILLLMLFVLTLLGTLEQANHSLQDTRDKYFDSLFFVSDFGIPFPGAYLILWILFANLLVGGFIRMRRSWSRVGIFIIHIGIAWLLVSGLIEHHTSRDGYMTLFEGESAADFRSHYDWDVSIIENLQNGQERVHVIPHEELPDPGEKMRYQAEGLPFEVELLGRLKNCQPQPARGHGGVEGFVLEELEPSAEAESDITGMTVRLVEPHGTKHEGLLWGVQMAPFHTRIDGRSFSVDLKKRRWPLPFQVTLKKFTRELHPRTGMASAFSSDITRLEDNVAQDVHISMNDPMRHRGYTFYQSGWGPQDAGPNARLFSTFAVVDNPADRGPLVACIIIGLGLLIQFWRKLILHIVAERRRHA